MSQSSHSGLSENLFRLSYAKTVAVLVRYFGLAEVASAEDIVQDTLIAAYEQWSVRGVPDNPEGWIMDVAKKKMINLLRREKTFESKVLPCLEERQTTAESEVEDSTLKMIFACCHPKLPVESQIALALKTLCGFSVPEISRALLTSKENIDKRLFRARQKFRTSKITFHIPDENTYEKRLDSVCKTLYLLFNGGYLDLHHQDVIRTDLCFDAFRLLEQVASKFPNVAKVNGLLALMYFSLARFKSRMNANDTLISLQDQDRDLWDQQLISMGMKYLNLSVHGNQVNSFQLQAGIAAEHCTAKSFETTNWQSIYDQYLILEQLEGGDLILMNKLIANFYMGYEELALKELLRLTESPILQNNPMYYLTLGVLCATKNETDKANRFCRLALTVSKSTIENKIIQRKMVELGLSK